MDTALTDERLDTDSILGSSRDESPMLVLSGALLRYECNGQPKSFFINHLATCTIGRNSANSIVLPDNLLSREHAMIRCSATGACELVDLGSSNGTRLNDILITEPVQLNSGDVIQVGRHLLIFEQADRLEHLIIDHQGVVDIPTSLENSLITALSINVRGYGQLMKLLGEDAVAHLLADVSVIACDTLTKRKSVRCRHEGTATQAIWVHPQDQLEGRDLLNILSAIAEIQIGLRPLQKRYNLLRPLGFGCGLTSGYASVDHVVDTDATNYSGLCEVVERAHRLELATRRTGCDALLSQSCLSLLSPHLPANQLPDLCIVSSKDFAEAEPAYALQFDQLGMLSAQIANIVTLAEWSPSI